MKDNIARQRIDNLSSEVSRLKHNQTFLDDRLPSPTGFSPFGYGPLVSPFSELTAGEILRRFKELYEFLNIERVTEPGRIVLRKRKASNPTA